MEMLTAHALPANDFYYQNYDLLKPMVTFEIIFIERESDRQNEINIFGGNRVY